MTSIGAYDWSHRNRKKTIKEYTGVQAACLLPAHIFVIPSKNGKKMCSSMLQRRNEERFAVQLSQVSHRTKNTAAVSSKAKGEQRDTKREGETRSMATCWSWCPVLKTLYRKLLHWPNNFEQDNESSVHATFAWGRYTNYIYAQLCKEKKRRIIRCKAIGSCWKETENRGECK